MQRLKMDWFQWIDAWYCLVVATLFLLYTSTCSPLYPFNDWVDANAYLTVGKGMFRGVVPYRDLFEQKGPLLYLIHAVAALFSRTTFIGVYIMEVLNLSAALYLAGRIVRLFLSDFWVYLILPCFAALTLISPNFESGDSAEEFSFVFILLALYVMIRYFKVRFPQPLTRSDAFWVGFAGGCVFLIKYTLLGYWIGLALVLLIAFIRLRRFRQLLGQAVWVIAGFAAACAPWLVYFLVNRALDDFLFAYLTVNIKFYVNTATLFERIRFIGQTVISNSQKNLVAALITALGVVLFMFSGALLPEKAGRPVLPVCLAVLAATTFFGTKTTQYYFLAFFPFLIFGLIAVAWIICRKAPAVAATLHKPHALISLLVVLVVLTISFNTNIPLLKKKVSEYPQYRFARIINQVPDATVLNYGFLDGGFYTAADVIPPFKYFMQNNISYSKFPELLDEQRRYVAESLPTFVVIRIGRDSDPTQYDPERLQQNYTLVDQATAEYTDSPNTVFRYALFRVNE